MRVPVQVRFEGNPRFQVRRPLGRGAFGLVYEVFDRHYNAVVALKLLQNSESSDIYRFKQEFRLLTGLVHPNLVTLYELHAEENQWFFTMEYVEGRHFSAYIRDHTPVSQRSNPPQAQEATRTMSQSPRRPSQGTSGRDDTKTIGALPNSLPEGPVPAEPEFALTPFSAEPKRLRDAFLRLAQGVRVLHMARIVHRDLKPSNVLVTDAGRVVLLDFGLAKELAPMPMDSTPEELAGTPAYMAPEQWLGERATEASDWYSVGVMLYESLTGRRPFVGPAAQRLQAQRKGPVPPSMVTYGVPSDLESLCMRLLAPLPQNRPTYEEIFACLASGQEDTGARSAPWVLSSHAHALIGREAELKELEEALQRSQLGQIEMVFLSGAPGLGKSTLVRRFLDSAHARGAVTLMGRCYEREAVPYKALDSLHDALVRHLLNLPPKERRKLIPSHVHALTALFPVFRAIKEMVPDKAPAISEHTEPLLARQHVVADLKELLGCMAQQRPLVLCCDDLQWGDMDSARLLAELLSPPDVPPLLFIASYRTGEAGGSVFLRELERQLTHTPGLAPRRELLLEPLPLEEASQLANYWLGTSSAQARLRAERIARESEGIPFLIEQLAREPEPGAGGRAAAPDSASPLGDVLGRRLRQLPEATRHLLELTAVAGRPTDEAVVLEAFRAGEAALSSLSLLRAQGLLRIRAGERTSLEVTHDRVREVVVAHIDASRLAGYHRRMAEVLEAQPEPDAELLTVHFHGAGELHKAAVHAFHAAERAYQALAFHRAAELFESALKWNGGAPNPALPGPRALKLRRAEALANAGRGAEAGPLFLEVAREGPESDSLDLQLRAIESLMYSGRIDEGLELVRPLLSQVGLSYAQTNVKALVNLLWQMLCLKLRGIELKQPREPTPAERLRQVDISWTLGKSLSGSDPLRSAGYQIQSLRLALDSGEPSRVARSLIVFGPMYLWQGTRQSVDKGRHYLELGTAIARRLQSPPLIGFAEIYQAALSFVLGEWRLALDQIESGMRLLQQHGTDVVWEINVGHTLASYVLQTTSGIRELQVRAAEWFRQAVNVGDLYSQVTASMAVTHCLIAQDQPEEARKLLHESLARWTHTGVIQQGFDFLRQAHADLYQGKPMAAWKRMAESWPALVSGQLLRTQYGRMEMYSTRARISLALAVEQAGRRSELLKQVVQDAARLGQELRRDAPYLERILRASVAQLHGKQENALTYLAAAADGYQAIGMPVYAACARWWQGELLRGAEGKALIQKARATLESEGIKRPRQWAASLVPGFDR